MGSPSQTEVLLNVNLPGVVTVTGAVAVLLRPSASVKVTVTVNVPFVVYLCPAFTVLGPRGVVAVRSPQSTTRVIWSAGVVSSVTTPWVRMTDWPIQSAADFSVNAPTGGTVSAAGSAAVRASGVEV